MGAFSLSTFDEAKDDCGSSGPDSGVAEADPSTFLHEGEEGGVDK